MRFSFIRSATPGNPGDSVQLRLAARSCVRASRHISCLVAPFSAFFRTPRNDRNVRFSHLARGSRARFPATTCGRIP